MLILYDEYFKILIQQIVFYVFIVKVVRRKLI